MTSEEKVKLYRDAHTAFRALCEVVYPNDEPIRKKEGLSPWALNVLDSCESALHGLSMLKASLEAEIGTDNL